VAERSEGRLFPEIARAAVEERADLYIGHLAHGLASAAFAARVHGARLGFDAEDYHPDQGGEPEQEARADYLLRRYLPQCAYVTAASEGIAAALVSRYGITSPTPVYNAFPWTERRLIDGNRRDRVDDTLSLYWYSQTVGLDRGIQDAIRAMGLLGGPVQLHVRGTLADDVRVELTQLAAACGVSDRVFFRDPVPPAELLSRAVEHDVGLALEYGTNLNRSIAATNKMFFYLLAGLAVAATDVPGQRAVLGVMPQAAALYPPGDHHALARSLERWRTNPSELATAKHCALDEARRRWNWETESATLVESVRDVMTPAQQLPRRPLGSPPLSRA